MGGIGGAVRGLLRADGPGPWREMLSALVREQTRLRKPRSSLGNHLPGTLRGRFERS